MVIYTIVLFAVLALIFFGGANGVAYAREKKNTYISPGWVFFFGVLALMGFMFVVNISGAR